MKKYLIAAVMLFSSIIALPASTAAVNVLQGPCSDDRARNAAVCQDSNTGGANPFIGSGGILTAIINIFSIVVGIVAIIIIVLAGLKFITSGDNPQEAANARQRVIYALVALVIAVSAQTIVRFVLERIVQV